MSLEYVASVIQGYKLTAMALTNVSKKFYVSGKLFWKQPLRGFHNGVLSTEANP